jgi:hypothetical protein
MGKTLIGNKKSLLDFIIRNMADDDVSIMTDNWLKAESSKKGMKIQMQYASQTFAEERGVKDMMQGKNIALWIGRPERVSEDTKRLFLNE